MYGVLGHNATYMHDRLMSTIIDLSNWLIVRAQIWSTPRAVYALTGTRPTLLQIPNYNCNGCK